MHAVKNIGECVAKLFKKQGNPFDALVEGSFHDEWAHQHYTVAKLSAPKDVQVINDGDYQYELYGTTQDFKNINLTTEPSGLEFKTESLISTSTMFIERPRSICLRDGRVFVDTDMKKDKAYLMQVVPNLINFAEHVFKCDTVEEAHISYGRIK